MIYLRMDQLSRCSCQSLDHRNGANFVKKYLHSWTHIQSNLEKSLSHRTVRFFQLILRLRIKYQKFLKQSFKLLVRIVKTCKRLSSKRVKLLILLQQRAKKNKETLSSLMLKRSWKNKSLQLLQTHSEIKTYHPRKLQQLLELIVQLISTQRYLRSQTTQQSLQSVQDSRHVPQSFMI